MSEPVDPSEYDIDPARLDRELLRQPGLTRRAGSPEADARHAYMQAKSRLDVVKARLTLAVRRQPSKFGLRDKPNEAEVDAAVMLEQDYQNAVRAVNEAKFALDVAAADSNAMLDRRKAIEGLVDLLSLEYWSEREPRAATAGGRDRMDDQRRRATRGGGYESD